MRQVRKQIYGVLTRTTDFATLSKLADTTRASEPSLYSTYARLLLVTRRHAAGSFKVVNYELY